MKSLPAALMSTAVRHPDKEAVVDGDIRLTYTEYSEAVVSFARAATALGIRKGDRVALWAQNSWQWCVASLGLQAAGAALVPINTRFRGREAAEIIHKSGSRALFTTTGFLGADYPKMLHDADPGLAHLPIVVIDGEPGENLSWDEFLAKGHAEPRSRTLALLSELGGADIADVVFTSGSTGAPKGVLQSHANVMTSMNAFVDARTLRATDRSLILAPMFAQFGLRGLAANIISGATTITCAVFQPSALFETLQTERITDFAGPPTLHAALLSEEAKAWDLSSLRLGLIGSTTVPAELVRRLLEDKVFEHVFTAWGLTEACGPVSFAPVDASIERIAQFAGKALPHVRIRVVAQDGTLAAPGEEGELQVLSATNMLGYLDEPELTAETLVDGGWLRTGDIGIIDSDGYVKITDRLKDMLIVGGFNVASAEVEATLRTCPGISEVAVIGWPDDRLGQVPVAFVVAQAGEIVDPHAVIAWSKESMANFKVPRHVAVVDSLPLNASLKVDKQKLRQMTAAF